MLLFQHQQGFTFSRSFDDLLVLDDFDQLLSTLGTTDHKYSHQLVLTEEELAVIFIAFLARLTLCNREHLS